MCGNAVLKLLTYVLLSTYTASSSIRCGSAASDIRPGGAYRIASLAIPELALGFT